MKSWRIWVITASIVITGAVGYFSAAPLKRTETYAGTELSDIAPDFSLMDQYGNLISLSEFGGKVVVLTFMDSQCKEVCPLTAAQLLQVYKRLDQRDADQVVFLAVNVNIHANTVSDVVQATQRWHLDEIHSWHFLTGDPEELESVWKGYGVAAEAIAGSDEIMHTPGVFLIDPGMQQRWYISTPYSTEGNAEPALPLSELLVEHIAEILGDT